MGRARFEPGDRVIVRTGKKESRLGTVAETRTESGFLMHVAVVYDKSRNDRRDRWLTVDLRSNNVGVEWDAFSPHNVEHASIVDLIARLA